MNRSLILLTGFLAASPATPGRACGQGRPVLLQIHPQVGDTLRLQLDEDVEMIGTIRKGDMRSTTREKSSLVLYSRLSVESADSEGSTVLATADSVHVRAEPNSTSGSMLAWAKMVEGKRFRFRVLLDGTTSIEAASGWAPTSTGFLSQLPATMPRQPIAPGETWTSAMDIPLAGAVDPGTTARLTATFHFDSLSRSGRHAYVSIHGRLLRPNPGPKGGGVEVIETSATVTGRIVVDRNRGWITDAHTTVVVNSLVAAAGRNRPPMRVGLTITQWVRVR